MKEAAINTEIVLSIGLIPKSWAWKIPDSSPALRTMERFVPARAFDIIASVHGCFFAIETKLIRGVGGLSVKRFTEFEVRCLRAVNRAGGCALVAVAYQGEATAAQAKKHGLEGTRVRELFVITWPIFEGLMAEVAAAGKGTIPRGRLVESGTRCKWMGKGKWEIETELYVAHPLSGGYHSDWTPGRTDDEWVPFSASTAGRECADGKLAAIIEPAREGAS